MTDDGRKKVRVDVTDHFEEIFGFNQRADSVTLASAIASLNAVKIKVPEEFRDGLMISLDACEYYNLVKVYYDRPETDAEYDARIREHNKALQAVTADEFATYERLKAKIEGLRPSLTEAEMAVQAAFAAQCGPKK